MSLKSILKKGQKKWKKARKDAENMGKSQVEDGRYVAKLVEVKPGKSQAGRDQIVFTYKILEGKPKGKKVSSFEGIETEKNLMFLANKISKFGYEVPEDATEIVDVVEELQKEKPTCRIRVKDNDGFANVYLDGLVDEEEVEESEEEEEEEEDEDEDEEESEDDDEEEESEDEDEDEDENEEESEEEEDDESEEEDDEDEDDEEDDEEEEEENEEEEDEDDEEGDDADEDEDEEEEGEEITKGMKVLVKKGKKKLPGKVTKIFEKDEAVNVKLDDGKLLKKVSIDKLEEYDEDEVPEEPKKKSKGKNGKSKGKKKKK